MDPRARRPCIVTVTVMNTATTLEPTATGTPLGQDPAATQMPPIWTIQDIAAFYRRSTKSAERLVRTEGFPRPLRGDRRRWWADEVQNWARSSVAFDNEGEILIHDKNVSPVARIRRPGPTPNQRHRSGRDSGMVVVR